VADDSLFLLVMLGISGPMGIGGVRDGAIELCRLCSQAARIQRFTIGSDPAAQLLYLALGFENPRESGAAAARSEMRPEEQVDSRSRWRAGVIRLATRRHVGPGDDGFADLAWPDRGRANATFTRTTETARRRRPASERRTESRDQGVQGNQGHRNRRPGSSAGKTRCGPASSGFSNEKST